MPLVKRLSGRGAKGVIVATGEALFAPGTDLSRWKNRFSANIRNQVIAAAPGHDYGKRPLRPHPGKRLKESITAGTDTDITAGGGMFHIAVGSSVAHALYVDQGTGIYNGGEPYEAKILPPFAPGSPTLFEKNRSRASIMIKGQPAQNFFEKGLDAAFRIMWVRSIAVPGEGVGSMRAAIARAPENLFGPGNTPNDLAFQGRLKIWREWKREAYDAERSATAAKNRAARAAQPKPRKTPAQRGKTGPQSVTKEKARFLAAMIKKYGSSNVERQSLELKSGYWYLTVRVKDEKGRWIFKEVRGKSSV